MCLHVRSPRGRDPERTYILQVLLTHFLGLDFDLTFADIANFVITDEAGVRFLVLPDIFFRTHLDIWLSPQSIPQAVAATWNCAAEPFVSMLESPDLPVLFGHPLDTGSFRNVNPTHIDLGLDIFGSAFYLLSLYEEASSPERDANGRFPETAGIAQRAGFVHRALVNEYLEVLWNSLSTLWPGLTRKSRTYTIRLSHDVDMPFGAIDLPWKLFLRGAAGDVLLRRSPLLAARRVLARLTNAPSNDPFFNFSWICDQSERHNLRSTFNFICGGNNIAYDAWYNILAPPMLELMRNISTRGHEIGLHPSYDSFDDPSAIQQQFDTLRRAAALTGVAQQSFGGRQHWLRFLTPDTWRHWDDAGLAYDSSIGFSEHIGFRCGTCYDFPVFDLGTRRELRLHEFPLHVMDIALILKDPSPGVSLERIRRIVAQCQRFGGDFVLLWHNNYLILPEYRDLYTAILDAAVTPLL